MALQEPDPTPLVVVMGVTGVGKSTIGEALAERLGLAYADADDFHPEANIAKMKSGVPLTDEDRWPWLRALGAWLAEHETPGGVASCSALRRAYRQVLVDAAPDVAFLHLAGDAATIRERVSQRAHHFMPSSLIDSQLDTLESLGPDERGLTVDLVTSPDETVEEFARWLDAH